MTFREELEPTLIDDLNRIITVMHADAIDYAPRGWTGELRASIFATSAIKRGKKIIVSLVAKAEYAKIVHDSIRRHMSNQGGPSYLSYADFGQSSNPKTSYRQGYRQQKDSSPRYAVKFLERAIFDNRRLVEAL